LQESDLKREFNSGRKILPRSTKFEKSSIPHKKSFPDLQNLKKQIRENFPFQVSSGRAGVGVSGYRRVIGDMGITEELVGG